MSEDWQWIGGACVITFLIWRGTVANKIGSAHVSSTSYREPDDDAEAIKPFESSHTAEDDLAAALIAYRSRAASAAGDAVRDVRQRHADAAEIVAKAEKFWRDAGIGHSLCRVIEQTRHYPTWSKRDDWARWNPLGLTHVDGGRYTPDGSSDSGEYVSFRWHDLTIKLTHVTDSIRMPVEDHFSFATQEIWIDGERMLAQMVTRSFGGDDRWKAFNVKALIIGNGEWVKALVEIDQAFQQSDMVDRAEREAARTREIADNIKM